MKPPATQSDPRSFLEAGFELPPLPGVALRARERIERGDARAAEVADLLVSDEALAAQILAIVNSAYYALPREVTDVRHAVAYLGLPEVHRLVSTAAVMVALVPADRKHLEPLWHHAFYTGLVARLLARKFERTLDPEPLQTAALLHDVGKLVYASLFPGPFEALNEHLEREGGRFQDAEHQLGQPSHARLGAVLAERWSLPQPVARACTAHELEHLVAHNEGERLDDELKVICIANLLCSLGTADREYRAAIHQAARQALGCDEDGFLLLMAEVYELKDSVQRFVEQLG